MPRKDHSLPRRNKIKEMREAVVKLQKEKAIGALYVLIKLAKEYVLHSFNRYAEYRFTFKLQFAWGGGGGEQHIFVVPYKNVGKGHEIYFGKVNICSQRYVHTDTPVS